MANQRDPNKTKVSMFFDLDVVAKVHTFARNKTKTVSSFGSRGVRNPKRRLTVANVCEDIIAEAVKNVKPDAEAMRWKAERKAANLKVRRQEDAAVRDGKYRKPKSEFEKPGPKKGNPSPKYLAAMKRLGEERQALKKQGIDWREKSNGKGKK